MYLVYTLKSWKKFQESDIDVIPELLASGKYKNVAVSVIKLCRTVYKCNCSRLKCHHISVNHRIKFIVSGNTQ